MVKPLGIDTSLSGVSPDTSLGPVDSPVDSPMPSFDVMPSLATLSQDANGKSDGESTSGVSVSTSKGREAVIAEARKYLGTWYHWGGANPKTGFDCSGLTQWALSVAGVRLPRVSYQQATFGKRVSIDQLQPGDLVAWDNSSRNNGADHIALYIGNGMVLHAPKTGDKVKISKIWGNPWGVHIQYPEE